MGVLLEDKEVLVGACRQLSDSFSSSSSVITGIQFKMLKVKYFAKYTGFIV